MRGLEIALAVGASFFGALLSGLGMGGGGILVIYLTLYLGLEQLTAQGINLIFFLPIAATALLWHQKNKLIRWDMVLPFVALGLPGVYFGIQLATRIGSQLLGKLFGGFLLIIGVRELFFQHPKEEEQQSSCQ